MKMLWSIFLEMWDPEKKKIIIIIIATGHEQYCLLVEIEKLHSTKNLTEGVSCKKDLLPDPRFRHYIWLMHRKLYVATSAVFFSTSVLLSTQIPSAGMGGTHEKTWIDLSLRLQQLRGENYLRWALCKWLPRRKNKAAARKQDILHRRSKSRSKTHLPNFENKNWGFQVKSRIEKLLYPAILHGKSIELASGCLVSKGLVTFPALYPALYRSQDHSNSPAGCHQHVQYVKQHKAEGQKST